MNALKQFMDQPPDNIEIEVAYALPHHQFLKRFSVPSGTTADQAITLSGICQIFPEIDLATLRIGIFSKLTKPGIILQNGDRVEIYRPLVLDPKEKRRKRLAEKNKKTA